jgi:single-strand DNA-binding protein
MVRDPEIRTNNDMTVARFSVAVNRDFKNKDGKYDADFINCIAFKNTAEFVEKYFSKGMRIGLIGRIQTGSYTNKDGQKVYTTDMVVEKTEFVENKGESKPEVKTESANDNGFVNAPAGIEDAELPFN